MRFSTLTSKDRLFRQNLVTSSPGFIYYLRRKAMKKTKTSYIALGTGVGVLFGVLFKNVALGLALGLVFGAAIDGVKYIQSKRG